MRTLILKFGAIGDVLMLVPAAHQLYLAGHAVDWVCSPAIAPVLDCFPWINVILADDHAILKGSLPAKVKSIFALWRILAGRRYDLAATLYYDRRYHLLTAPVRARRKLLLSDLEPARRLLPGRHHTDEYARILLDLPDEVRPTPLAPVPAGNLPPSPVPRRPGRRRVILAPAGARNMMRDDLLRRWPAELYAELTGTLLKHDIEIVLIGSASDAWVRPFFQDLPVIDLIGALELRQTLALLDEADVLVTHDTGPLHLAGVTGVGIVALFGPTDPRGRLPQRAGTVALWGGEGFACRPCYDGHSFAPCPSNDCMRQVTPAHVAAEVLRMLEDRAQGRLRPPLIVSPASTVPAQILSSTLHPLLGRHPVPSSA